MHPLEIIQAFTEAHQCKLTISENNEHAFMQQEDMEIVAKWLKDNI